jgi:hypothetical protein
MSTRKGTSLDGAKGSTRSDKVKITDLINLYKFPEKKWTVLRLDDGVMHSYATGWVKGKTKEGKAIKFPVNMPSYDPETQEFDSTIYDPWYDLYTSEKGVDRDSATIQLGRKFYMNAISRQAQKQKPSTIHKPTAKERETGFKDKDSDTWTMWVPVALPPSVIDKLKELKGLNVVESKRTGASKTYSVAHAKFGCDIRIYYDSSKSPAQQYEVQLGERRPLTEEEIAGLKWDTSGLSTEQTEKEIRADYESWAKRMGLGLNKSKKSKGRDEEDEEDDEDDEDDTPPSKSKSKAKAKKRPDPDDEDDEEDDDDAGLDDDDDLDDEDDTPPPKSKGKAKAAVKSKGKAKRPDPDEDDEDEDEDDDEDSDDDLDDDDEDDEDDTPPAKSKSKAKPSTSAKVKGKAKRPDPEDEDDEDDDLDEDDEDDEDDTPPPKSKGKAKAPASKAKSKRPDPDEDEDDDEEDEDADDDLDEDDEDDTPPPKKSKSKASATVASKKRK